MNNNNTTTHKNLIAISGNTYPVKDALKAIGARWNAESKAWMVTADKVAEAQEIVAGAGPESARLEREIRHNNRERRIYRGEIADTAVDNWHGTDWGF